MTRDYAWLREQMTHYQLGSGKPQDKLNLGCAIHLWQRSHQCGRGRDVIPGVITTIARSDR